MEKCTYACGSVEHLLSRRSFLGGVAAGTLGFAGMIHPVTAKELQSGRPEFKASAVNGLRPSAVASYLRVRRLARLDDKVAPKFKPGDSVLTHNDHPIGHTRLPRYARGKRGVIVRDHGVFIFPDTHAMTRDKKPQHCYSVRFAARELWGHQASARDSVYLDLWDDHLDPA